MAAQVHASQLTIRVLSDGGKPVRDAVVTLKPVGQAAPAMRMGGPYRVEQHNIMFHPFLTVIPAGAEVAFPNLDAVRHHVYSFSPAKTFELKLFGKGETRSIRFDRAGIIAVGCNIHDSMSAFIFVSDTVWTARTDANGLVTFADAPARATVAAVWHPYLRAPGSTVSRQLALGSANASEVFQVKLRSPPVHSNAAY